MKLPITLLILLIQVAKLSSQSVKPDESLKKSTQVKPPMVINNLNKQINKEYLVLDGKKMAINSRFGLDPEGVHTLETKRDDQSIAYLTIKTKDSYIPKLISLHDLRVMYLKEDFQDCIFFINKHLVEIDSNNHSDQIFVDENYILKIILDKIIYNEEQQTTLGVINIFTKSKENIEESKRIIIR